MQEYTILNINLCLLSHYMNWIFIKIKIGPTFNNFNTIRALFDLHGPAEAKEIK